MTSSPLPFLCFIFFGLAIMIFMASSIELDVINTYPASPVTDINYLTIDTLRDIHTGDAFAYTNRNEAMIRIKILGVSTTDGKKILQLSEKDASAVRVLTGFLSLDVPSGKESLLHRIFAKGGKSND